MNQTTELTFSFRVPGCGIASALSGLALAAQIEKLLSENGCALQLGHIYTGTPRVGTEVTLASSDPAVQERITEGAAALSAEYGAPAGPAETTPAPEPEKPKRTRAPKELPAKGSAPPAPQPEEPAAPACGLKDGNVCCEILRTLHRTGRSAAAAGGMPQWNGVTEAIVAAGYTGVTAITAALAEPKTAAKALEDVNAIADACERSLAELEAAIAAKKAKSEAAEID